MGQEQNEVTPVPVPSRDSRLPERKRKRLLCRLSQSLKLDHYSLRNSDFDIPTFNTINYGKHSIRYKGPHIWSKLDNKLKGSLNIESFKTCFKKNIRKKTNNSCWNLTILRDYLLYTQCLLYNLYMLHATSFL